MANDFPQRLLDAAVRDVTKLTETVSGEELAALCADLRVATAAVLRELDAGGYWLQHEHDDAGVLHDPSAWADKLEATDV